MNAKEEYTIRCQMAEMHEEFIERLSEAYDNGYYVEAVWYCYAIIEQRINRIISKYINKCCIPERTDNKSVAISTRMNCIKTIINAGYGVYSIIPLELLDRINKWCDKRNDLVHSLVSLKHYRKYDEEFKNLADEGTPLIFEFYDVCTDFRNEWYRATEPKESFPKIKCKCTRQKCINENNI